MKEGAIIRKQSRLLKDLAAVDAQLDDAEEGRSKLARELRGKSVLVVVDNVWGDQLEFLLPEGFMQLLGEGSMVLVTSREQGAAGELQQVTAVEMRCLSDEQSMELFCKYAFPGLAPAPSSWEKHVEQSRWASQILAALKMCAGLPMALEVVGRYFETCDDKDEFRDSFRRACRQPIAGRKEEERSLFGALRLSWNILEPEEQEALLDIALMLKGAPWDWVQHHCGAPVLARLCGLGLVKQQQYEWEFNSEYASAIDAQVVVHDAVSFFCADVDAIGGLPQRRALSTTSEMRQVCCPASQGESACVSGCEEGRQPAGMGAWC
jgi:hypothetical protein